MEDEQLFAAWADQLPDQRRAVIARIFSLSGPHINKFETYALASFILDALRGQPVVVRASTPVVRSYVAIRELMSLVFSALLAEDGNHVLRFDSGGEPLELGEVARLVADTLGPVSVDRKPIQNGRPNHYFGDGERYRALLLEHGIDHVDLSTQVIETAGYLAKQAGVER